MVRDRGRFWPALIVLGGGLLALAGPVQARERLTGEQELAKMLAGRVAGKPVNCLMLTETHDSTVIDKTAIVYRVGRVLYVNRPSHPEALDSDAVQVVKLHMDELCQIDTIEMHDRTTHMFTGFVTLEQFVPYTRR